ncbi:MAG: HopJ type III effector protein [Psychromonas sp.]
MLINTFLEQLDVTPEKVEFSDSMAVIDNNYEFTATEFSNGEQTNLVGQNAGSCKIFAFAQLQGLTQAQTLACFGGYYRDDVIKHPNGQDHQNIRQFIIHGWQGINFKGQALLQK